MKRTAGNKFPDSVGGVKTYIKEHDLKDCYCLSNDLEIIPDPNLKNKWLVIDHGAKLGLLIDLMEDPTGGVPEYDYDQVVQYSKKKKKESTINALRRLSASLKKPS